MADFRVELLAVALLATSFAAGPAEANAFRPASGDAVDSATVEIGNDTGGYVADYALRMFDVMSSRKPVKFVGSCDSACTLFLALPRNQTCAETGASFRFHAPVAPTESAARAVKAFMMREYPRWVQSWIARQGGLTDRIVTMDYSYVSQYMRSCA